MIRNSYVWGLEFLRLGVSLLTFGFSNSYIWVLVFLTFRGEFSYDWELVFLRLGVSNSYV